MMTVADDDHLRRAPQRSPFRDLLTKNVSAVTFSSCALGSSDGCASCCDLSAETNSGFASVSINGVAVASIMEVASP